MQPSYFANEAERSATTPARTAGKRTGPLTPGQADFLRRFLLTWNASKAYREAYPTANLVTASRNGNHLLRHALIAPEVKAAKDEIAARYKINKTNALAEVAALAFSNVKDHYDRNGALIPLDTLPHHTAAAIKKMKSKEIKAVDLVTGEEKVIGHTHELELHDKIAALRVVGQYVGLFAEEDADRGLVRGFAELLREARARVAAPAVPTIEGEKVAK